MENFMTINETVKTGLVNESFLRRMVKANRCPGLYSGTRFYVNVPLLRAQLQQDSVQPKDRNIDEEINDGD